MEPDVVDTSALEGLRAFRQPGLPDPVPRIVGLFISETESRLAVLREAVRKRDLLQTERLAHAQKGSSGTLGANEVRRIAQELEQVAIAGSAEQLDALMAALDAAFDRSRARLQEFMAEQAA